MKYGNIYSGTRLFLAVPVNCLLCTFLPAAALQYHASFALTQFAEPMSFSLQALQYPPLFLTIGSFDRRLSHTSNKNQQENTVHKKANEQMY